jgi:hypothetical protein
VPSLDEFAVGKGRKKGQASFWSSLPDDVREQIVASDAPSEVCVQWLHSLGFDRATFGNTDPMRRRARREREADAG